MNNFQTIFVAIFIAFFVFGVMIFSGLIKIGKTNTGTISGKVVVWGTFPTAYIKDTIDLIVSNNKNVSVKYEKKEQSTYQQDLIEAFAEGKGPDLYIITPDMIVRNKNFIYKIPYTSYPQKVFTDSFIDGASIYLDNEGIIGMPLFVDPIVLYYNKDILSNEGIVNPPTTWDELFNLNSVLTKKENDGTINRSMIALGQYDNITNAKDILATLLIQNDNPLAKKDSLGYVSTLNDNSLNYAVSPIEAVLKFFIEFSNPSNNAYSWNRSFSSSSEMFTGGKLAFYIGRSSELFNIQTVNPNLSFDVTRIPQIKDAPNKKTFGEIYAVVISKKSSNLTSAFQIANELSNVENAKNLSIQASLPPVSRTLLAQKPENPYLYSFFDSAIVSRSWVDPDKIKSDLIFKELIDNILSNKLSMSQAVSKAQGQIDILFKK